MDSVDFFNQHCAVGTWLAFVHLMNPEFVEVRGCVLRKRSYTPGNFDDWYRQLNGDVRSIEALLNRFVVGYEIGCGDTAEEEEALGDIARAVARSWEAALGRAFPQRRFDVRVLDTDDGPTVVFGQVPSAPAALQEPWLRVVSRDTIAREVDLLPASSGMTFVARLDGAAMADGDGIFEQFWERFRFPDYFGWNWNALSDCLRDLNWLPADRYLVVIENSAQLLSASPEDRAAFFALLKQVAEHWRSPHHKPRGVGIPFTVLLVCEPGEAGADLLGPGEIPDVFVYPVEFLRAVESGLVGLEPWWLLEGDALRARAVGLLERFPERRLLPFARREDNDDVACWDLDSGAVRVVHDFATPGRENRQEFATFYDWLRAALEDFIEFAGADSPRATTPAAYGGA
ncbi:barstar family protein [Streptomyces roseoverticillatus]|uniref:barstar family protein n=1 Tax=Streptomyces roseoverticillatus TaxID=66429 RepID=UPI001B802B49|nr:barstar family protein [Streptomyces roseoverticillatus]